VVDLEKRARVSILNDFYGCLLTERQRTLIELYYEHDLSLGEIAQRLGVSRQAVHDLLRRSERALEGYEARLGLVARFGDRQALLEELAEVVHHLPGEMAERARVLLARLREV
jgi:predicted DNA-binding protein YlxM (UPF0122 family)